MKVEKTTKNGDKKHQTVAALFFNGEKMLIIQKADPAYQKKYSVIAGHVEDGETIEDALLREVYEETGLNISEFELMAVFVDLADK